MAVTRKRLGVLLSGSGTTLENLFEQRDQGALDADLAVVLGSKPDAYGLERARRRGVPAVCVPRKSYKGVDAFSDAVHGALHPYALDGLILAGFMCMLRITPQLKNRVLNVHPSLLPAFGGQGYYGIHVQEAVLAHGCKIAGCTVHFVSDEYDDGPIIAQQAVPVQENDTPQTLMERVQAAERTLFPQAIQWFCQDRLTIEGRCVRVNP